MIKNECSWVIMDKDGCNGTCENEGTRNNTKICTNARVGQHLLTRDRGKKNNVNFGLVKKTNREDNKQNFGRGRAAKGLGMNLSKGQAHIIAKNAWKK